MASSEVGEQVRALRGQGLSPKQIARALGMSPAAVAPLVRAAAAESGRKPPAPALIGCWVSPGRAIGLTVPGGHAWPGLPAPPESGTSGMVTVAVAREQSGSKVTACAYLVDTYCLRVKWRSTCCSGQSTTPAAWASSRIRTSPDAPTT